MDIGNGQLTKCAHGSMQNAIREMEEGAANVLVVSGMWNTQRKIEIINEKHI